MNREPDTCELYDWKNSIVVEVRTWCDPAMDPYDGDNPEDAEGCEGWDLLVECEINLGGNRFSGSASLCSNWVRCDHSGWELIQETIEGLRDEALSELRRELEAVANGRDMRLAAEQKRASGVLLEALR